MKWLPGLFLGLVFLNACSTPAPVVVKHEGPSRAQQTLDELYSRGKEERIAGRPHECLKTFGKLIDMRKTVQDSLYAYSLYQSGLCHEMLEDNAKAIAVYQDALRVRAIVNSELSELEIPSRLAVAYSRVGEKDVAEKYYSQTKAYIEKLIKNKKHFLGKKEYYAEVLFQMGTIAHDYNADQINVSDFESYLKSIHYSQDYMLLVLDLNVAPYSGYALKQMVNNFQKTFDMIKAIPTSSMNDEVVAQRERQEQQKQMAEMLASHIDEFETAAPVKKNSSSRADYKEMYEKLSEIKQGLNSLINERPVGEGLTPEAKKLSAPKKEGTFVPIDGEKE